MGNLFLGFILTFVGALSFANEVPDDDFDSSIDALKNSISDVYSSTEVLKIQEAPKNRRVVFLRASGFHQGNNSYTYLAVFEKSQKAVNTQGETYEYFGNIHFRLIGYIQVGGHHVGNIDTANVTITNDIINVPVNYHVSGLLMLNGEAIKTSAPMLKVKINSFGLSYSL